MRTTVKLCTILLFLAPVFSQEPTPTPESIRENVVVIAARTDSRVGDTPASVSVISNTDLKTSASPAVDETLRQSVGFSTFRRSGSRTSNPTTQGVLLFGGVAGQSGAADYRLEFVRINDGGTSHLSFEKGDK